MKMLTCAMAVTEAICLLLCAYRNKVGVSLVLSSPAQSLNLGHRVGPPIVAIEHGEQTHHLTDALPVTTTPINHAMRCVSFSRLLQQQL